ncbi:MAG: hypothetical protein K6F08_00370 [bacterium]|nr:hypothetical protein [bacterium]
MKVTNVDINLNDNNESVKSGILNKIAVVFIVLSYFVVAVSDALLSMFSSDYSALFSMGGGTTGLILFIFISAIINFLFFLFEFWVYKQILGFNIFTFTIPKNAMKDSFYYAVGIRNFIISVLAIASLLLFPLAYGFLIVADLLVLATCLFIAILSLIKKYVPLAIKPLVFKTYVKPLIIVMFIFVAIKVLGFLL